MTKLLGQLFDTLACWPCIATIGAALGIMFMQCSWCRRLLWPKRAGGVRGIGHGMCRPCADKQIEDAERLAKEYGR